jgi:hypothetical protein
MTAADQLAEARCKLGLSLTDISSRTKISVERLSAVERADPAALPPLLYLKGFVRAYAAEVNLDPELIWRRYTSELANAVEPTPLDESLIVVSQDADALAEFDSENDRADPMPPQPTSTVFEVGPAVEPPLGAAEIEPVGADETAVVAASHVPLAPPVERKYFPLVFVLATVAAFVSAYLWSANFDRYRDGSDAVRASAPLSQPGPGSSANAAANQQPSLPPSGDTDKERREPAQTVPPAVTGRPSLQTDVGSDTPAAPSASIRNSTSNVAGTQSAGRRSDSALGRGADQSLPGTAPPPVADPEPPTTSGTAGRADTISGAWNVTSKVESATVAAYQDLVLGFHLDLEQRGNKVVGEGRKVSENGVVLPEQRRTPITVEGTLEGNRLALDFTEVGARRKSAGHFLLYLAEDGSFRGRFRSEAAKSNGMTVAVRQSASGRH